MQKMQDVHSGGEFLEFWLWGVRSNRYAGSNGKRVEYTPGQLFFSLPGGYSPKHFRKRLEPKISAPALKRKTSASIHLHCLGSKSSKFPGWNVEGLSLEQRIEFFSTSDVHPKALEAALQGRTSFAIAHRLSTIQGREIFFAKKSRGSVKKRNVEGKLIDG